MSRLKIENLAAYCELEVNSPASIRGGASSGMQAILLLSGEKPTQADSDQLDGSESVSVLRQEPELGMLVLI